MLDQSGPLNSLGFDKAPADTRVVVAMSGGVDSSVVAAELKTQGSKPRTHSQSPELRICNANSKTQTQN